MSISSRKQLQKNEINPSRLPSSLIIEVEQGGQQIQRMKFPEVSRFSRPFLVKFQTIYK